MHTKGNNSLVPESFGFTKTSSCQYHLFSFNTVILNPVTLMTTILAYTRVIKFTYFNVVIFVQYV